MSQPPIEVTNEITINHWELGRHFAEWDSQQQALFLHGMYEGLMGLGGSYGIQLLAVLDYAKAEGFEMDIAELTATLHTYLTPGQDQ